MPKKIQESDDPKASKFARAKRLLAARHLLGLSRDTLGERHGITRGTLQNWETPIRRNGLTLNGAKRIAHALKAEGLNCTVEWLMYGVGDPPQITENLLTAFATKSIDMKPNEETEQEETAQISKELLIFREAYPDYIDMIVPDDAMAPRFIEGEFIAGRRRFGDNIDSVLQLDCIVHLADNEIILRNIRPGSQPGLYTLACTNPNTKIKKPFLYDVELLSAAPVIWARRRN